MIRRTYRSKKDTANALDHKDMLQTLDEKNSVFDAFYIQNIKQTKKELSCLGTSNQYYSPSTKIKKRKHVKKIVKEVDHAIRESIADSIYLTPEKSSHVNRPQDPFDLLFNSSNNEPDPPSNNKLVTNADKVNLKPVWEPKTYTRKKDPKKYNYSSSDTDSDKENSLKDISDKNVSDIKSHKLLIEKDINLKQNEIDESICHIINKIPQLQKQNEMKNQPKHRLTNNLISSLSPSCSTPFKEKHRSYSIYKFSPICVKDSRNSSFCINGKANTVTNTENQIDFQHSPILQMSKTMKLDKSKHLQQLSPHIVTQKNDTISEMVGMCDDSQLDDVVENTPSNDTFNELHLKASESKPFLGFSQTSIKGTINKNIIKNIEADLTENSNIDLDIQSVTEQPDDITAIPEEVEESFVNNVSCCTELEAFIGFSLKSSACLANQEKLPDKHSNDLESSNDISSQSSNTSHSQHIENHPNEVKETHLQSEDTSSNESAISSDYENAEQTCYDTCDSEESEEEPCKRVPEKLSLIQAERLQSSIFKKYYDVYKHTKNKETVEQNTSSDSDSSSSNSESCDTTKIEIPKHNITVENKTNSQNIDCVVISSSEGDCVEPTSNDEDNCISFVTTRRRNEVANRSSLFMLEDTFASPSSSECDKTVISINNNVTLSMHTQNNLDKYQQDLREVMQERKTRLHKRNSNLRQSVMTRKSSRILRESNIEPQEENKLDYSEVKPGIVLQPGKKWERSLSIYRRMTMTSDHFDHSLIIAEDEAFKGRKYRQSVINAMELQDQSLIHNVSISSRRSTFVSKPSRSSIRIVKKSNVSRLSLCESAVFDDIKDDTLLELSKLSIADSEREVTVLDQFNDSSRDFHESRGTTARDYVLRRCNQTDVIFFDECYPEIELKNCHKIGEGVYGEVFLWRARDGCARVMKIVPIAGTTKVNGENQKDFQEIIAEIVIAMELSALRTPLSEIELYLDEGKDIETLDLHSVGNATDVFNEILAVRCVYGPYPSRLLDLWELYDEVKGSENDNPAVLPNDQQYIVLELANAGQDLEGYQFNNAEQAHALFWQVAFGLAVGEEAFQFEHRDLHWGNVLIAPTDQKSATFVLRGQLYRIPRCGVAATIIDYSLSRLSLQLYKCESAALFNDLATDDALFDAVGDYQFEVYRRMRDKLGNEWKNYEPYTNILWLHYTVDKMITALRYKRTNTKVHKHYIAKLKGIKNRILEYGSATQFVLTDNEN